MQNKTIKRLATLALLLGLAPAARAQQVLLQTEVANDTLPARTGPNRRYFGHVYGSYGLAVGSGDLQVKNGFGSFELQVGGRLKRRLGPYLALNADLRYAYLHYVLADDGVRPAPFLGPHEVEVISLHQLQGEASLRLTPARRRGNVVGRYLDLLAYGGPALATTYATTDPAPSGGGRLEVVRHQPDFLARWQGGVGLRLGSNSLALVGRYRLSDALRPVGAQPLPEPPRLVLGVEIGWF